jgi:hypothetical protein
VPPRRITSTSTSRRSRTISRSTASHRRKQRVAGGAPALAGALRVNASGRGLALIPTARATIGGGQQPCGTTTHAAVFEVARSDSDPSTPWGGCGSACRGSWSMGPPVFSPLGVARAVLFLDRRGPASAGSRLRVGVYLPTPWGRLLFGLGRHRSSISRPFLGMTVGRALLAIPSAAGRVNGRRRY